MVNRVAPDLSHTTSSHYVKLILTRSVLCPELGQRMDIQADVPLGWGGKGVGEHMSFI